MPEKNLALIGAGYWGKNLVRSIGGHDAASCPLIPHDEKYPVAERIARQGLYLPSGLTLTETQIDLICDTVKAILEN
jgi:dTDP-4-amino-4,6-dideoxygalactose transaminase